MVEVTKVKKKRKYIHSQLIEHGLSSSLKEWNATHLQRMYELYDEEFFDKEISEKLRISGSTVKFQTTSGKNAKIGTGQSNGASNGKRQLFEK